jgi:hypothetical protein
VTLWLAGIGHGEGVDDLTTRPGVAGRRQPIRSEREPVSPVAHGTQDVVVGVVLEHHHNDVVDFREGVGPGGQERVRE